MLLTWYGLYKFGDYYDSNSMFLAPVIEMFKRWEQKYNTE